MSNNKQKQEVCNHCGGDGIYITNDSERVKCPWCEKGKITKEEAKQEYPTCECGSDWLNTTAKNKPFCFKCGKGTNQETLEEAAEKYANGWLEIHPELDPEDMTPIEVSKIDFIEGTKWQAERMYSEEEVRKISLDFFYYWWNSKGNNTEQGFDEWFEQFKN